MTVRLREESIFERLRLQLNDMKNDVDELYLGVRFREGSILRELTAFFLLETYMDARIAAELATASCILQEGLPNSSLCCRKENYASSSRLV